MTVSTVSNIGLDQAGGSSAGRSAIRHARQDFEQLFQSLQAGNLGAAQQAYNSFQQVQAGLTTPAAAAPAPTGAVGADWTALGSALQSGSLSAAQGAFGQLQQDAQTVWQSRLQQETQNAQSVYALMQGSQGPAALSGSPAASASPPGSVQNDLHALTQALQSGDTAGAQNVLAQLEQDLQASAQASGQNYGGHHHHRHHGGVASLSAAAVNATPPSTTASSTASV